MPVNITFTVVNLSGKPTIYSDLKDRLGREPSNQELVEEVERILRSK